jgi:hypothetical protein
MAAISISSAAQYMDDKRMQDLAEDVRQTAAEISRELGWSGRAPLKRPANLRATRPKKLYRVGVPR